MIMSVVTICALTVAAIACVWDLKSARIPNWLTFTAAAVAIVFHTFAPEGSGLGVAARGLVIGLAVFFPVFALRAMGAGDIKLLGALGAWLGGKAVLFVAIYASIAGAVLALIVMAARGYLREGLTNIKALVMFWWVEGLKPVPALTLDAPNSVRLPYAVPIAVGLVVTLWR